MTSDGVPFLLLSKKVQFPDDIPDFYQYVQVSENIPWTVMSWKLYDKIDYWWVLSSLNPDSPFYAKSSSTVKYIPLDILETLLKMV